MSSIAAVADQLKRRVKEAIKFGQPKDAIIQAMRRTFGPDLGPDEVQREVEQIVESFADYELIQRIFRSKIVREIDGRDSLILDPVTRSVVKITSERLRELLHKKVDISERIVTCEFKYDPYSMKQLYKDSSGIWTYNQYRPPFWQADTFYDSSPLDPEPKLPKMYHKFLMHLVDNDELSYEYTLDWLANAIQARNFCILTTIGNQGVGKGTLGEIMKALVGEDNYSETGNRIFAERFNGQIKNKRIVYCDEASVKSQKEEERLKSLVNGALEVEAKGKDAESVINYASIYFSSNSMDAVKLSADDRRFSIVCLTEKKLIEVMRSDEIKALTLPENIDKLARYLYYRPVDANKMLNVFISPRTEEIRSAGLAVWHDWFLDEYCVDNASKVIKVEDASAAIEDRFGSKTRPGKKAFMELSKMYPQKFKVFKPMLAGKQVWALKFAGDDNA